MTLFPNCIRVDEDSFHLALQYFSRKEPENFKTIKYFSEEAGEIMEFPGFGAIIYDKVNPDLRAFLIMQNKAMEFMTKN